MIPAIIPARGGSKGVPRKNLREIGGKPLIAWSIEDALESQAVTSVYVSTDDAEIARVAEEYGAAVIHRPPGLSGDTCTSESALLHALDEIVRREGEPEWVVFLQATCPFRSGADLDAALKLLRMEQADSLLSAVDSHVFLWEERGGKVASLNYDFRHRPRRQDAEPQYRENGSFYVFKPSILRKFNNRLGGKILLYKMPERSGIDIDTELDFALADFLIRNESEMV